MEADSQVLTLGKQSINMCLFGEIFDSLEIIFSTVFPFLLLENLLHHDIHFKVFV